MTGRRPAAPSAWQSCARRSTAGLVCTAGLALLGGGAAAAAGAPGGAPTGPDQVVSPTQKQLEDSVTAVTPEGSVMRWDPGGSVTPLETETAEGDQTVLRLDTDILFAFGSADLDDRAATRIGELVEEFPAQAAASITGHTDAVGDDAANLTLSQRRAQAVASAVTARRADLVLDVQGRGETQPVAANASGGDDDPAGRAQNRRVEIRYTTS